MTTTARSKATEALIVAALFVAGALIAHATLRDFRAAGMQPSFYQGNFEPAVMMACGRGFVTTTFQAVPASLQDFLHLKRNDFRCADLPANLPRVRVTWNGTWFYLYGTTAMIWRVTGISWTALDGLVVVMGGVTTAALYGSFRLVTWQWLASVMALVMTLAPANRVYFSYLRDYSKAPFVLVATFMLGLLVVRPMTRSRTIGVAALFGAIVGLGYGFRTDLMIMLPDSAASIHDRPEYAVRFANSGTWNDTLGTNALLAAVHIP